MNRKNLMIIIIVISVAIDIFWALTLWPPYLTNSDIIPIFGLPQGTTAIILWFLFPLVGGMIAVVLMPRIVAPIFMLFKRVYMKDYVSAYVDSEEYQFDASAFLKRYVYSYLLLIGFMTLASKFIPANLLLTEFAYVNLPLGGEDPQTHITFLITAGGLLSPLVVGLWSVGWSFDASGLVHFSTSAKKGSKNLKEFEPIHVRYNSYLKGYAGLSSILFVVGMIFSLYESGRIMNIIAILTLPLHLILMLIPAMYLHSKTSSMWLRRNLPRVKEGVLQTTDLLETGN